MHREKATGVDRASVEGQHHTQGVIAAGRTTPVGKMAKYPHAASVIDWYLGGCK